MGIVYILLPASLLLALVAVLGYLWCVRNGQFDDLETPALKVLADDEHDPKTKSVHQKKSGVNPKD